MQFRRIYIKNFQSIKELEIVLEENSCYHIKGANNIGKSAFLKALEMIVRNVSRNVGRFIRDGADSFYIEISDFDSNVVSLSRGKEDFYSWEIDGDSGRVDGTAGQVPKEVKRYFNFYEEMEKSKEIVNIRPARSKLLFTDTSFAENYYLLQRALRIEEYLKAIKLGDKRKKDKKKEIQGLIDREEETKGSIGKLKNYNVLLDDLNVYIEASNNYENQIDELLEVLELFNSIEKREEFLGNTNIDFDSEVLRKDIEKIKLLNETIYLMKSIEVKESKLNDKEELIEVSSNLKSTYEELIKFKAKKDLLESTELLKEKVSTLEKKVSSKNEIIETANINDFKNKISHLKDGNDIVLKAVGFREKSLSIKEKENLVLVYENERKDFMVANKFCPVVLSMVDRTCPFSGQTLEELLAK